MATPTRAGHQPRCQNAVAMGSAQDNMIGTLSTATAMQGGAGRDAMSAPLLRRPPVHHTRPLIQPAQDARVTTATKLTAQELHAKLHRRRAQLTHPLVRAADASATADTKLTPQLMDANLFRAQLTHPLPESADVNVTTDTKLTPQQMDAKLLLRQQHAQAS